MDVAVGDSVTVCNQQQKQSMAEEVVVVVVVVILGSKNGEGGCR